MKDKVFEKPIEKKFEFDEAVASVFDDMLNRSVPFYDEVLNLTVYFALKYLKNDEIKNMIYDKINRGVTYIKAEGGYTGKEMNMLFCAMNRRQVSVMRDLVKRIDPKAIVLLTDVYDVMGYGFRSRSLDLAADE